MAVRIEGKIIDIVAEGIFYFTTNGGYTKNDICGSLDMLVRRRRKGWIAWKHSPIEPGIETQDREP